MGDPVTMAVVGGTIGAATNRKDPLKGALMGAAGGYAGGSLMGAGSTSPFSIGSFMNGIGTNFAAGGDPLKGAAMNAAALAGSGGGFSGGGYGSATGANAVSSGGGFGSGGGSLFGFETPFSGIGRAIDPVTSAISGANTWMNQNPTTSQIGFKLAQDMLQAEPVQMPGGMPVNRGQIQPMDYMSLLAPQQSQVLRPATPSLI